MHGLVLNFNSTSVLQCRTVQCISGWLSMQKRFKGVVLVCIQVHHGHCCYIHLKYRFIQLWLLVQNFHFLSLLDTQLEIHVHCTASLDHFAWSMRMHAELERSRKSMSFPSIKACTEVQLLCHAWTEPRGNFRSRLPIVWGSLRLAQRTRHACASQARLGRLAKLIKLHKQVY